MLWCPCKVLVVRAAVSKTLNTPPPVGSDSWMPGCSLVNRLVASDLIVAWGILVFATAAAVVPTSQRAA